MSTRKYLIALFLMSAFLLVCFAFIRALFPILPRSPDQVEIEERCGFGLHGADLLYSHSNFLMKQLFAKYRIPRNRIESLLNGLPKNSRILVSKRIDLYESDLSWWKPNQSGKLISIIARPANHFETRILVIVNDQDAIIYLYHST